MGAVLPPRRETPIRVLLLDQSQGSQARRALLQDAGCPITLSSSAADALRRLAAEHFDVVVADHESPNSDAALLIQQIRQIRPRIAVILISAFVEALGLSEITTGADILIPKSAHEVYHLTRSITRLRRRKPSRKLPTSEVAAVTMPLEKKTV